MRSLENQILILGLINGDKAAFRKIYTLYHDSLYGMAYRYLRNSQLADDAVQDIFVKLWTERKNLDVDKSLHGFLFSSIKNHVLNMIRSNARRIERNYEYYCSNGIDNSDPEIILIDSNYNDFLNKGIESLPPLKKEIFLLRNKGTSYKDIAEMTGCSINTVKSYLHQTRHYLRDYISSRFGEKNINDRN